jgi:hypothetical protein
MNKYQPKDDCPDGHKAAPCPLYGGPIPELEWGPATGLGATFPTAPGPDGSVLRFGECAVCGAQITCDKDGTPRGAH